MILRPPPRRFYPRVLRSDTLSDPESTLFKVLDPPMDVKWRVTTPSIKIKSTKQPTTGFGVQKASYAENFASHFGCTIAEDGYALTDSNQVLMPTVSSCIIGDTLYLYPAKRCVIETIGNFDLVDCRGEPNVTRLPGVSLGFVGTVWGLIDNDSYARCKNMTSLSNDSGFNAITEVKTSVNKTWADPWTLAFITEARRTAREVIPDMPLSTRRRESPAYASKIWDRVNDTRESRGMCVIGECAHQVAWFKFVEMWEQGEDHSFPAACTPLTPLTPPPVSKPPEISPPPTPSTPGESEKTPGESEKEEATDDLPVKVPPAVAAIISSTEAGPADLGAIDEKLLEEHSQLEMNSGDQLGFIPGPFTLPAVDYLIAGGKTIMNPAAITETEVKEMKRNLDDTKAWSSRRIQFGQGFGKRGFVPANTTNTSMLTEVVRQKPIPEATKKIDLNFLGLGIREIQTTSIQLPPFESVAIEDIGDTEAELKKRIEEMNNSRSRQRMSKVLSEFYGTSIEVLTLKRNDDPFVTNPRVKLIEVEVKVFTKGDELIMKAKPRSIKFPQSWFWLVTVLNLEAQLAAIKRDELWSWRPIPDLNFRLYWASGMTQEKLSQAWSVAIQNGPGNLGESGEYFAFICGDDNSDELGAADASSYDMTQRKFFAECQFASMKGFESAVIKSLKRLHQGKRRGKGFFYYQQQMGNPSGSPFTLFINSLGMGIYTAERARVRKYAEQEIGRPLIPAEMDKLSKAVGAAYGLEITYTPAPELGVTGAGIEFLKGCFIPYNMRPGGPSGPGFIWTPLPSRIIKAGKVIIDGEKSLSPSEMNAQLTSVANSYISAVQSPLLSDWVGIWRDSKRKPDLNKGWVNITYEGSPEFLACGRDSAFLENAHMIFAQRYGWTYDEFSSLRAEILKRKREFGWFTGEAWERLSLVDYQGQSFNA